MRMQTDAGTRTLEALARVRIGGRIRAARQAHGLTAKQLADKVGISDTHLYNIEAGRSRATLELRQQLGAELGLDAAYFAETT